MTEVTRSKEEGKLQTAIVRSNMMKLKPEKLRAHVFINNEKKEVNLYLLKRIHSVKKIKVACPSKPVLLN